jgi:hypothetical protein
VRMWPGSHICAGHRHVGTRRRPSGLSPRDGSGSRSAALAAPSNPPKSSLALVQQSVPGHRHRPCRRFGDDVMILAVYQTGSYIEGSGPIAGT